MERFIREKREPAELTVYLNWIFTASIEWFLNCHTFLASVKIEWLTNIFDNIYE